MKRHLRYTAVVWSLLLLALCPTVHAQNNYLYATGNPSFGLNIPIENGYINVANGNVHLELPLSQLKQRGDLQLDERLVYDSRIWQTVDTTGNQSWQPTNVPNSMAGWRFVSGLPASDQPTPTVESYYSCDNYGDYGTVYSYSWTDNTGTPHLFDTSWNYMPDNCPETPFSETGTGYATDSSGYNISLSGQSDDNFPSPTSSIVIYDNNGNEVYPNAIDRFGNSWSQDSNGNLIDDLGRTPVTMTTPSGNQIAYSVLSFGGGHVTYTVTTEQINVSTAFDQSDVSEFSGGTIWAIQSIQLPDLSSYSFTYDSYGEVAGMTLSSGGTVSLSYGNYQDSYYNENRWLTSYSGGHGSYSFSPGVITYCSGSQQTGCVEQMYVTDASGNQTLYGLTMNGGGAWNTGTGIYSGPASGGNMLVNTSTVYNYSQSCNTPGICPAGAAYVTKQSDNTILYDAGLQTQTLYGYNPQLGKATSVKQWDYYSGSPASAPTIDTEYSYANTGYDLTQVKVLDGSGSTVALTNYNFIATATPAPAGLVGHGPANPDNLTYPYLGSIVQWAGGSSNLTTTFTNDDSGTRLTSTDPNGQTTFGYDSTETYVTTVTPPTPSSGVSLLQSATYDPSTGLLTSTTDPNGAQTTYSSYDWAGRVGQINYPDGGSETFTNYSPVDRGDAHTMNGTTSTQHRTLLDLYGRFSRVADFNGQSANPWYQTDYCYDANGRLQFKSYRYQGNGWATGIVCSGAGETYSYDGLSRVNQVLHGDGTYVSYQHTGPATEVTDENGVQRIAQTNILGRTSAVCEISSNGSMPGSSSPASCGTAIPGTGFLTSYAYSLASHTTTVTQGLQTRVFQTDPLGRTTLVQEPESGTITYSYTYNSTGGNGLLVKRTRPQANQTNPSVLTTTTTQYDAVGRVVSVNYSDGITPYKVFAYDTAQGQGWDDQAPNATYLKGRLAVMGAATSTGTDWTGTLFSYDPMGRTIGMWQCAPSICGTANQGSRYLGFSYDWTGNLSSYSDPDSGTVVYYRSPAGEVTSITNQSYTIAGGYNPGVNNPLVPSVQNGPFGPTSYNLANGLGVAVQYDSLGRLTGNYVCSGAPQITCSGETEQYAFWILRQGQRINEACYGPCAILGYDEFNRLTSSNLAGGEQAFSYTYDQYGNRWAQTVTSGSGPPWSASFNAQTNQINMAGYGYDAAGNLINGPANDVEHSYQYDAEGNLLSIDAGNTAAYVYDALNRRVVANNTAGDNEFSYDYAGRRISAWPTNGASGPEGRIYWGSRQIAFRSYNGLTYFEHPDWLGTDRIRTDPTGAIAVGYASLAFGDGNTQTVTWDGASQDNNSFTSLELDPETETYHAQFRQYGPAQGSWMSPDPYSGSYDMNNPQSFNRYSYVLNNPLAFTDPSGLFTCGTGCNPDPCGETGCFDGPPGPGSPTGNALPLPPIPTVSLDPNNAAQNNTCTQPILNAVNNRFGTNLTSDDVQGNPFPNGEATNINILATGLPAGQFNSIQPGRYPANPLTWLIGYGPTLHVTGQTLLDPSPAQFANANVGGATSVVFTAHIDSSFAYNPIGALIHLFEDVLHLGGPRNPCP